jgi:hypothetical protein
MRAYLRAREKRQSIQRSARSQSRLPVMHSEQNYTSHSIRDANPMLQAQRQYGNRYVQRTLAQAKQTSGEQINKDAGAGSAFKETPTQHRRRAQRGRRRAVISRTFETSQLGWKSQQGGHADEARLAWFDEQPATQGRGDLESRTRSDFSRRQGFSIGLDAQAQASGGLEDSGIPSIDANELDSGVNGGSASAVAAATGDCCCCVTDVSVRNVRRFDTAVRMGHRFDVQIGLDYSTPPPRSAGGSCSLEWWERTNIPYFAVTRANTWTELYATHSTNPVFAGWNNRTAACNTRESVTLTDPPSLGKRPGRTVRRTLEFDIKVNSAPNCGCRSAMKHATPVQVLSMVNGAADWANSSFTP